MRSRKIGIKFSIRALLSLMLVIAIVSGLISARIAKFRHLQELSLNIDSLGGDVSWVAPDHFIDSENRAHILYPLETVDGREFFANLINPRFLHVNLGKDNSEIITNLKGFADYVMSIACDDCKLPLGLVLPNTAFVYVDDPDGDTVRKLLNALKPGCLKWLMIATNKLDERFIYLLKQQDNIEVLDIEVESADGLSDEFFNLLRELDKLESIHVSGVNFSVDNLQDLCAKHSLRRLNLACPNLEGQERDVIRSLSAFTTRISFTINGFEMENGFEMDSNSLYLIVHRR